MARFLYLFGMIMTVIALVLPALRFFSTPKDVLGLAPPLTFGDVVVTIAGVAEGAIPALILFALGGLLTRLDELVANTSPKSDGSASNT